jgi:hypothetical protein
MKVRLIRKLANCLDGIDVKDHKVGDLLDLAPADGVILVAEGWAVPEHSDDDERRGMMKREDELIGTS